MAWYFISICPASYLRVTFIQPNWISHKLCRSCPLKHVVGDVEGAGRRGRRRSKLVDGLKETGRYWTLNEESLD